MYLLPTFGNMLVASVSRADLIQWSRMLLTSGGKKAKGLAPKTVNCALSLMRNILEFTSWKKELSTADTRGIFVKQPQKPMRILSRAEQQRLSGYLRGNLIPCNMGILLCLYIGLRIGKICALLWEDILMEEQCLYIHRTMQCIQVVKGHTDKRTEIVILLPKRDCSIRRIPIPDETRRLLLQCKSRTKRFCLRGWHTAMWNRAIRKTTSGR